MMSTAGTGDRAKISTFEVTIHRRERSDDQAWPIVVEQSSPGSYRRSRSEGVLGLDLIELRSQAGAQAYGAVLGQALFRDAVRDALFVARGHAGDGLRILLNIEAPELRLLHWERLCVPDRFSSTQSGESWSLLALDQRMPLSLYLPGPTGRQFPPLGRHNLRALAVAVSPPNQPAFDVEAALVGVQTALAPLGTNRLATLGAGTSIPTADALLDRLTAGRYTLLHLVCHGESLGEDGETVLFLPESAGNDARMSATRLLERLARLREGGGLPHFIYLSTCHSASVRSERPGALGGLGQRLVRELGVPAVVAMTEDVSVETANALAENFYRQLLQHGEVDRALAEATAELARRHDVTTAAVFSLLGGEPVFSEALDRELSDDELETGLNRLETLVRERAPVLAEQARDATDTLRRTGGIDPAVLQAEARSTRERALVEVNNLVQEITDLGSFHGLALLGELPGNDYDGRCPFRGLYPFSAAQEDRDFFFGRADTVKRLQARLAENNFLAVLGASGSGKSSLVLAGLAPALAVERLAHVKPGSDPTAQLEESLATLDGPPDLIFIDQFEELFTLCTEQERRRVFVECLLDKARTNKVVIALRTDFWGNCGDHPALNERIEARHELISALDAQQLRTVMEQQANVVGLRFEVGLADKIVADVQDQPGAMPLLQHALLALWNHRHGRWLRTREYEAIGGVSRAVAETAQTAYEYADQQQRVPRAEAEKAHIQRIFLRLTRLDQNVATGERPRDTRQRVPIDELASDTADVETTHSLVAQLAEEGVRLVVTSTNSVTGCREAEIAHEALIRHWDQLQEWIKADRELLLWRQQLRADMERWSELRAEDLPVARGWLRERISDLNESERRFIRQSIDAEEARQLKELERQRRRQRITMVVGIVMTVLFLLMTVAAMFAGWQYKLADTNQKEARSRALAAHAINELELDPELSVRLATRATDIAATAEAHDSLLRALLASRGQLTLSPLPTASANMTNDARFSSAHFSRTGDRILTSSDNGWAALWNTRTGDRIVDLQAHGSAIRSAVFNRDDSRIVTASADGVARIWDGQTGALIQELRGHRGELLSAVFDGGNRVLTTSMDATARIWDLDAGSSVQLVGHKQRVNSGSFDPQGRWVATASSDQTVGIWDAKTGNLIKMLPYHSEPVTRAVFSPSGEYLATGAGFTGGYLDPRLFLWNTSTWNTPTWPEPVVLTGVDRPYDIAFSPDSRLIAAAYGDGIGRVWDVSSRSGDRATELKGHSNWVWSIAFSPDGQFIVTAGQHDRTARIWFARSGVSLATLRGSTRAILSAEFSYDGKQVVTADAEGEARVFEVRAPLALSGQAAHTKPVRTAYFDSDGSRIVTSSLDGTVKVWSARNGQIITTLPNTGAALISAMFIPGSADLLTASVDGVVRIWRANADTWTPDANMLTQRGRHLDGLSVSPDGKLVAVVASDGTVQMFPLQDPSRRVMLKGQTPPVFSARFSPDARIVVTSSGDKTVRFWSAATGEPIAPRTVLNPQIVSSAEFGPNGTRVVTANSIQNLARIIDVKTGGEILPLFGIGGAVWYAGFSPKGAYVLTVESDGTARLRSANTGNVLASFPGHGSNIWGLTFGSFSPNGRRLVTLGADTIPLVFDCEECQDNVDLHAIAARRRLPGLTADEEARFDPSGAPQ